MKVSNAMIHRDVRLIGALLRPMTANVSEAGFRKARDSAEKKLDKAKPKHAKMTKEYLTRADGSQMRTLILRPEHETGAVPTIVFLHGGGYVLGSPEEKIGFMEQLLAATDCVIVAPAYTLALDAPYPAALDDAYLALCWAAEHAEELGGRSDQLFVVGESAGGGLAAALTIRARARGGPSIAFQMPLFPMLDDRGETDSARENDAPMWNAKSNTLAWQLYLGARYGTDDVPAEAAPARLADFSDLPPAYSYVGTIEPFYDETRIYFEKLTAAGVAARLDTYAGGFHGFDEMGKNKPLGKLARQRRDEALRYAAAHHFRAQKQKGE